MRWPHLHRNPIIVTPPTAATMPHGWCGDAYRASVVVSAMTLAHFDDEQLSMQMRGVLLDHAERLVEILKGDAVRIGETKQ